MEFGAQNTPKDREFYALYAHITHSTLKRRFNAQKMPLNVYLCKYMRSLVSMRFEARKKLNVLQYATRKTRILRYIAYFY